MKLSAPNVLAWVLWWSLAYVCMIGWVSLTMTEILFYNTCAQLIHIYIQIAQNAQNAPNDVRTHDALHHVVSSFTTMFGSMLAMCAYACVFSLFNNSCECLFAIPCCGELQYSKKYWTHRIFCRCSIQFKVIVCADNGTLFYILVWIDKQHKRLKGGNKISLCHIIIRSFPLKYLVFIVKMYMINVIEANCEWREWRQHRT